MFYWKFFKRWKRMNNKPFNLESKVFFRDSEEFWTPIAKKCSHRVFAQVMGIEHSVLDAGIQPSITFSFLEGQNNDND